MFCFSNFYSDGFIQTIYISTKINNNIYKNNKNRFVYETAIIADNLLFNIPLRFFQF